MVARRRQAAALVGCLLSSSFTLLQGCGVRSNPSLEIGDGTYVCIVVSGFTDWSTNDGSPFKRVAFNPTVDEYTHLEVDGAWGSEDAASDPLMSNLSVPLGTTTLAIHVESEGAISFQKEFRSDGRTFPLFSAIVSVDAGKVTGITWDDGCFFCDDGSSNCVPNTYTYAGEKYSDGGKECFLSDSTCTDADGLVSKACALGVYVSWSGTDKYGNYLLSQGLRFSRFDADAVGAYLEKKETQYS